MTPAEVLRADGRRYGRRFVRLRVPAHGTPAGLVAAWRNREFLAQLYRDVDKLGDGGHDRLSVCRTRLAPNGQRWADGIGWDELQAVKSAVGFYDRWAVEVFPPDVDVINVANIRHLWLLDEPPAYGWHP